MKYQPVTVHAPVPQGPRGPHSHCEVLLCQHFGKPLAILHETENYYDLVLYDRDMETLHGPGRGFIVVGPPGEESRANMLRRAVKMRRAHKIGILTYHARLGRLLGYTKHDIRWFIQEVQR